MEDTLKESLIAENEHGNEIVEVAVTDSATAQHGDADHSRSNTSDIAPHVLTYLYLGHFLARWGSRMWEFSVPLFMIHVWPDSLILTALYGVVETASVAICGSVIGGWIDNMHDLKVLKLWLGLQNFSFVAAGVAVTLLLSSSEIRFGGPLFVSLVVIINAFGALGALTSLAGAILIERDWVIVISEGQPPAILTQMNAVTRRIDLSCKLLAPVAAGFIMSYISMLASAVFFVICNMLCVGLEYWLLSSVFFTVPSLNKHKKVNKVPENTGTNGDTLGCSEEVFSSTDLIPANENIATQNLMQLKSWLRELFQKVMQLPTVHGWSVYIQQDVVLAGLSLALLYFTVLSFGTLMTATLEWKGIPSFVLGLARAGSALVGISATVLYPIVHSHLHSLRTGLWSVWIQWSLLSICVASIWVPSKQLSAWMLMIGVATSRLGLWMFDLSVVQQMQDSVPKSDRGIVGGVQNSLQSFMDLMTYVMGMIVSNPKDFGALVILSYTSVTISALLYSLHTYRMAIIQQWIGPGGNTWDGSVLKQLCKEQD